MELGVLLPNNDNSCFHKRGNLFCSVTQVWRGRLEIVIMFKSFVCRQLNGTLTLPLEFMQKNSIFNSKLKQTKFIFLNWEYSLKTRVADTLPLEFMQKAGKEFCSSEECGICRRKNFWEIFTAFMMDLDYKTKYCWSSSHQNTAYWCHYCL